MGIKLKNGEIVNPPPVGETELTIAADGSIQTTNSGGVTTPLVSGLTAPITNAELDTMPTHTIKANITAGTAAPTNITRTELTAELNAATTSLQGALSSADKVKINTLATQYYTALIATGNTITCTGMNGDSEGTYFIEGELFIIQANTKVAFAPNSQSLNLEGIAASIVGGPATDAQQGAKWQLNQNGVNDGWLFASGSKIYFTGWMRAKSGRNRSIQVRCFATGGAAAYGTGFSRSTFTLDGDWTDTATNMTTFQVNGSVANSLDIGSWMSCKPLLVTS